MRLIIALTAFTNPAWADCVGSERTFMSRSFDNGKVVEVCMTDNHSRYSFGRIGQAPELTLSLQFGLGVKAVPGLALGAPFGKHCG
jgi:hypothetical protein